MAEESKESAGCAGALVHKNTARDELRAHFPEVEGNTFLSVGHTPSDDGMVVHLREEHGVVHHANHDQRMAGAVNKEGEVWHCRQPALAVQCLDKRPHSPGHQVQQNTASAMGIVNSRGETSCKSSCNWDPPSGG